jgi:Transposase IS66 family
MTPPSSESIEELPLSELRRFVSTLASEVGRLGTLLEAMDAQIEALEASNVTLKTEAQDLKDEVARLKGLPPRPKFKGKPSGMEKATSPGPGGQGRSKRRRGSKRDQLNVTAEVVLKASPPAGSRFLGYEDILVQDLKIQVVSVRYRKERWAGPSGERIVASLPAGILGGYGPELRRFIAAGHFQGQMTAERLTALLGGMGMGHLQAASGAPVKPRARRPDRGGSSRPARRPGDGAVDHRGRHRPPPCRQIGDDRFAVFRSGPSKSRRAFLALLRAGHEDFVVDTNALQYMRERGLAGPVIAALAAHPDKLFADADAWQAHLQALGAPWLQIAPDPVAVATEGALWGAIRAHGLMANTVVVSDGAGQFRLADHALCWVHAERLVYKLTPTNARHRKAVDLTRTLIWWFYKDLKAYKTDPDPKRARALHAPFDRIFKRKTGHILLDRLLGRLHKRKAELLRVLERPEIPLHTNGSENDIRSWVTKRKISGGTVSDAGKTARDTMLGLLKTCAKLNVSFYRFLGDRFAVPGAPHVPSLPYMVRLAAA